MFPPWQAGFAQAEAFCRLGTALSLVLGRAEGCSALGPELYHNRYVLFPPHPLTRRRTIALKDQLSLLPLASQLLVSVTEYVS